jgi:hypothetical protein
VIASLQSTTGSTPVVWDPQSDTLTNVWGGSGAGPAFVAYSRSHDLWVLADPRSGCGVVLERVGEATPAQHCTRLTLQAGLTPSAASFAEDQFLAVSSEHSVRILDPQLADTGDEHPIPAGEFAVQIVPIGGARLLVVVTDSLDASSHVLGCTGNGPCESALDSGPAEQVVLARP